MVVKNAAMTATPPSKISVDFFNWKQENPLVFTAALHHIGNTVQNISWLFQLKIWKSVDFLSSHTWNELIFSTYFLLFPKFPLVPEGSTWYNLFACRYIMASVWYIPLGGFLRSRLLYCWFSCNRSYIILVPQVPPLVHFHELLQDVTLDKYLSPDFEDGQLSSLHKISQGISSDARIVRSFFNG